MPRCRAAYAAASFTPRDAAARFYCFSYAPAAERASLRRAAAFLRFRRRLLPMFSMRLIRGGAALLLSRDARQPQPAADAL